MLGLNHYDHFFKTQNGIAFVVNASGFKIICMHVAKTDNGFFYVVATHDENGNCKELGDHFKITEVTTIKEAGFEDWLNACLEANHPLGKEYNTRIVSTRDETSGSVKFICCPTPQDVNDRNSFAICDYDKLSPRMVDIRVYRFRELRNDLGKIALAYASPTNKGKTPESKIKALAMKSAIFHYTETRDPEKFVLYNLETEEAFIISKE